MKLNNNPIPQKVIDIYYNVEMLLWIYSDTGDDAILTRKYIN